MSRKVRLAQLLNQTWGLLIFFFAPLSPKVAARKVTMLDFCPENIHEDNNTVVEKGQSYSPANAILAPPKTESIADCPPSSPPSYFDLRRTFPAKPGSMSLYVHQLSRSVTVPSFLTISS